MVTYYRGLIITYPYGTYIRSHTKTLIVKSKRLPKLSLKPLLLIENKLGLGIIQLSDPVQITLEEFNKNRKHHLITDSDRLEWWPNYFTLYSYTITSISMFKHPILLDYGPGPQITIKPENIYLKRINIGTAGLTVPNFESYPMNFIEINYTFYKYPSPNFIKHLSQLNLRYVIKVNKYITHSKQLIHVDTVWKDFYDLFTLISHQIVGFLFQFSSNFAFNLKTYTRLKKLKLSKKHIYAFEFRQSEWYTNPRVTKLFAKKNWCRVITHHQKNWMGDLLDGFNPTLSTYISTSDWIYFRLHGTQGQYTGSYGRSLLQTIRDFVKANIRTGAIIVFNNTDDGSALTDALELRGKFNINNYN